MVLCPPSPGSQLLRAGLGAGLAQTEVLDGSAEWMPGWHLAGCSQTFSGISWTHTRILPLYLTASSLWEGTGLASLSPAPAWPTMGAPKTRLVVKSQLLPPPPQNRQISSHGIVHKRGKNLKEMGLTFSNGSPSTLLTEKLYLMLQKPKQKNLKTTQAALSEPKVLGGVNQEERVLPTV